jgi:beta-glucanase (GH16 family)
MHIWISRFEIRLWCQNDKFYIGYHWKRSAARNPTQVLTVYLHYITTRYFFTREGDILKPALSRHAWDFRGMAKVLTQMDDRDVCSHIWTGPRAVRSNIIVKICTFTLGNATIYFLAVNSDIPTSQYRKWAKTCWRNIKGCWTVPTAV